MVEAQKKKEVVWMGEWNGVQLMVLRRGGSRFRVPRFYYAPLKFYLVTKKGGPQTKIAQSSEGGGRCVSTSSLVM